MKHIKYYISALLLAGSMFTSCSDVDIPGSADLARVMNLEYTVQNRSVTLSWNAPEGDVKGYQVLQNGVRIASLAETSYTVDKVEAGVEQAFTVKAEYGDGTVSEGLTVYVTVEFSGPKSAYLVLAGALDDDEQASYDWFKANYVDQNKGEFIPVDEVSKLDPEIYGCLMIHIDRVGIGKGADRLPLDETAKAAIANYGKKGGNLFLSNHAAQLVAGLGRIDARYDANIFSDGEGGDNPDIWNVCPYLGYSCEPRYDNTSHPFFAGMETANVSDWAPGYSTAAPGHKEDHNCCWDLNGYGFDLNRYGNTVNAYQKINKCTVLATWSHVKDYAVGVAMDYNPTATWAGRIIAIGTNCYEWNQPGNTFQTNIEKMAANALNYMAEVPEYVPSTDDAFYGYVQLGEPSSLDDDELASYNWFKTNYVDAGKGAFIPVNAINSISPEDYTCIMVHVDRVGMGNNVQNLPAGIGGGSALNAIGNYVKNGGNLFLCNMASLLVQGIGRIPANCKITVFGDGNGGTGDDVWTACPYQGYQDFGNPEGQCYDHTGHAIYRGIELEQFSDWAPGIPLIGPGQREDHNCLWDVNAMEYKGGVNNIKNFEDDQNCSCLATWSHVKDWCVSGITEFYAKDEYKGRIIAIGLAAYEWNQNSGPNPYQGNIEKIAKNALDYLN